jgi:hypothetical protein
MFAWRGPRGVYVLGFAYDVRFYYNRPVSSGLMDDFRELSSEKFIMCVTDRPIRQRKKHLW